MCGIAGSISLSKEAVDRLEERLACMRRLLEHRGPDGHGTWVHASRRLGLTHTRLSVIDLATGAQPMTDGLGNWIAFNGEIYNYIELRSEIGPSEFTTSSDTEVILRAYHKWGTGCLHHLRGMFSFALWDEENQQLFCARDRLGIKPLYYVELEGAFSFASEAKALLPLLDRIETDPEAFADYLAFQFCLPGKTLFAGVREVPPGHTLTVRNGRVRMARYWEVYYRLDLDHTERYFEERLRALLADSVRVHLRSDVPIGIYLSGGLDSTVVTSLASRESDNDLVCVTGKYSLGPEFDESGHARSVAKASGLDLVELEITVEDFIQYLPRVIHHLDYPIAGPGSFSQFMLARRASALRKVMLGGQGGDEIFGGYVRYLIAYFEQCIRGAIEGTLRSGNFIVTYESIIPNLVALNGYKPLLQEFWRDGLFEPTDRRYFRLIHRASGLRQEVRWDLLGGYSPFEVFRQLFHSQNVRKESYFDQMTHFDLKTLLPALLHVEDRVSMAHGVESRVPFLDHPVVEFAATIPSDIKFRDGTLKRILKSAMQGIVPDSVLARKDKMGFPTPLTQWARGEAREFVHDTLLCAKALTRPLVDNRKVVDGMDSEPQFGRKLWGFLCLELWQQAFHDKAAEFRGLLTPSRQVS